METLARVLVTSADLRRARALATRLAARGYATIPAEAGMGALKTLREAQPDLVVVDAEADGPRAIALAEGVKSSADTRHIPVAILAPKANMQFRRACLAAGADDVITGDVPDAVLVARLTPLIRLATMTNELRARRETLRDMGIRFEPSKIEAASREPSVLMMATEATAADGKAVARALADDCLVSFSTDVFEAAELLIGANFDALAIAAEDEVERTLYLCSHIRNNPRLFNLPILVIADKNSFPDPATPYQRGASLVLHRPLDPAELHDQALTLARRQRTIYAVRRQLADSLAEFDARRADRAVRPPLLRQPSEPPHRGGGTVAKAALARPLRGRERGLVRASVRRAGARQRPPSGGALDRGLGARRGHAGTGRGRRDRRGAAGHRARGSARRGAPHRGRAAQHQFHGRGFRRTPTRSVSGSAPAPPRPSPATRSTG